MNREYNAIEIEVAKRREGVQIVSPEVATRNLVKAKVNDRER